jgi:hypothetical protein
MPDTMVDNRGIEMGQATEIPLILGGHSFISQLGNDPPVSGSSIHAWIMVFDGLILLINPNGSPSATRFMHLAGEAKRQS